MAASFPLDAAVLRFRLRPVPADQPKLREHLLWPAYAWRVVAPQVHRPKLNALQRATLGVLHGGRHTAEELGRRLGVEPELAAFVAQELQVHGRLSDTWAVTARGRAALEEESQAEAQLVPGWVFQDPWTGDLWPAVTRALEHAQTEPGEKGFPLLIIGDTAHQRRVRPWVQLCRRPRVVAPDALAILSASERHRRLERHTRRMRDETLDPMVDEELDLEPEAGEARRLPLDRITHIEESPVPVFLATYLYLPRQDAAELDWFACDPFGLGASPDLRDRVLRASSEDPHLAGVLDRLLKGTVYGSREGLIAERQKAEARARGLLVRALTVDGLDLPEATPLLDQLSDWMELSDLGEHGPQRRRRAVIGAARLVLERLFRTLAERWPVTDAGARLTRDRDSNSSLINAAARAVGLRAPVQEQLRHVPKDQVEAVGRYSDAWRLRPLVVATLLVAERAPDHALRAAAKRAPGLLDELIELITLSGKAAHDDPRWTFELGQCQHSVALALRLVALMRGLGEPTTNDILKML